MVWEDTKDEKRKLCDGDTGGGGGSAVQLCGGAGGAAGGAAGDYVSGMAKAWSTGKLCSKTGLRGILKKLGYLALVGVAGVVDWLVRYGLTQVGVEVSFRFLMAAMVIVWLIINELISILENVAALGGPVPGFLQKLLGRLKDTVEKKAEGESDADHRDNV